MSETKIPDDLRMKYSGITFPAAFGDLVSDLVKRLDASKAREKELREEIEQWETWGIVEIAVRNPNVASYVEHWEGRTKKAEKENASLRAQRAEATKPVTDEERERWYRVGFEDCRAQSLHVVDEHDGYSSRIGLLEPTLTEMDARAAKGGD